MEKCKNGEELHKDLPGNFFLKLDLFIKYHIWKFNYDTLERECFLVNQLNFNYFFRFYEIRKKSRYLILSNSEKSKINKDASNCKTDAHCTKDGIFH